MDNNISLNFFENYKKKACGITLDLSRQKISQKDFSSLLEFLQSRKVIESFNDMRQGKTVNISEQRSALHTSLRDPSPFAPHAKEVKETLERVCKFADNIRNRQWKGITGEPITDVINIGIGGSELGPRTVYNALRKEKNQIKLHFLAPADGIIFDRITEGLNPFKTLVVISSKSFKTLETQANSAEILNWFNKAGIEGKDLSKHVVVVSSKLEAPEQIGIPKSNFFPIWDWVGGRFSVWSAAGLPIAIALGSDVFRRFLAGAHEMDEHASHFPLMDNLPALMAAFAYWNVNKVDVSSFCFLPYDERLRTMVDWLQQLEMESLGKSISTSGKPVVGKTSLPVWGDHGNESQHSFFQWLREGTSRNAIDVCWCKTPGHLHKELNKVLMSNVNAQIEALIMRNANSMYFNVLSTLTLDNLEPETLGALMALYEHKTTMLGTLLDINPFDQPGVELGKILAKKVIEETI